MKVIGLLGGMSWESTVGYYRAINEEVKSYLGGLHSAKIVLYSVDFAPIEKLLRKPNFMTFGPAGPYFGGRDNIIVNKFQGWHSKMSM